LGAVCKNAREDICPDVRPNNAEMMSNQDIDTMAATLGEMIEAIIPGVATPNREDIKKWLEAEHEY